MAAPISFDDLTFPDRGDTSRRSVLDFLGRERPTFDCAALDNTICGFFSRGGLPGSGLGFDPGSFYICQQLPWGVKFQNDAPPVSSKKRGQSATSPCVAITFDW